MRSTSIIIFLMIVLMVLSLWAIAFKISPYRCCSCPPETYRFYPLSLVFVENQVLKHDCECLPNTGCASSFYVIPIDIIVIALVLALILTLKFKRKRES